MMPSKHWPMAVVLGATFVVLTASVAWADSESLPPAPHRSWAEIVPLTPGGTAPYTKPLCACGGAHALSEGVQPILIQVRLRDAMGLPVSGFASENILLCYESDDPFQYNIGFCPGEIAFARADADTDVFGMTSFTGGLAGRGILPPGAGGARVYVVLDGVPTPLNGTSPNGSTGRLPLFFNSGDNNGDGQVGLADLGKFAADFNSGGTTFESDLVRDGVLDLQDVVEFAYHYAHGCP